MFLSEDFNKVEAPSNINLAEAFPIATLNEEYILESVYGDRVITLSEEDANKAKEEIDEYIGKVKQVLEDIKKDTSKAKKYNIAALVSLGINFLCFVVGTSTGMFAVTLPIQLASLIIQLILQTKASGLIASNASKIRSYKSRIHALKNKDSVRKNDKLFQKLDELEDALNEVNAENNLM